MGRCGYTQDLTGVMNLLNNYVVESEKNRNFNMQLVYYHVVTKRMLSGTHALLHPSQHPNADLDATLNVVKQHSEKAPTLIP